MANTTSTSLINYSLCPVFSNPTDKNSERKIIARPQYRKKLSTEQLAYHIKEHNSEFSIGTIIGVSYALVSCIREQLLEGNKVELGQLGDFAVTFKSKMVDSTDEFNPALHISSVEPKWTAGNWLTGLLQDAQFQYVTTRRQQASAKKNAKEALDATVKGGSSADGNGGSGGGDGSGNDDAGDISD